MYPHYLVLAGIVSVQKAMYLWRPVLYAFLVDVDNPSYRLRYIGLCCGVHCG